MKKPIPETTLEKCKEYKTTIRNCGCVDKIRKSGSYKINNLNVCKHQVKLIQTTEAIFWNWKPHKNMNPAVIIFAYARSSFNEAGTDAST